MPGLNNAENTINLDNDYVYFSRMLKNRKH